MIKWRDVVVCYEPDSRHPVNALDGVSLSVAPGEWVFFVGPSGAGKSTLLKLVYGGAHAHKGAIVVDGQDVTRLAAREIPLLRRKIGVVFQDFQLLGQKTVWENIAFALQVIGAPQKRLVRDVPRALETVGLSHKADARPHELSGGEAQRVAIARAIVNDPLILVADEPTGNLDPQTAWDIAQVLQRVNARGTTVLMATHDRALVDRMKNRVVRIANGRVLSDQAQGEYHPEDDAIPVSSNAPGAASNLASSPANTPRTVSSPVPAALSNGASSNAPLLNGTSLNAASLNAAPSDTKPHKPVSAFAGQVDASPVTDTPSDDAPSAAPGPHMSTHVTTSSVAASSVATSSTPNAQTLTPPNADTQQKVATVVPPTATATAPAPAILNAPVAKPLAPSKPPAPPRPTAPANASSPSNAAPSTSISNALHPPMTSLKAPIPQSSEPAIAPSRAAGNGDAAYHDSIDRARLNQAPIGSPENPIIQLDRAPEVQMPHEVEA